MKHTQGPWIVCKQSTPDRKFWIGGGEDTGGFVREVAQVFTHHSEGEANAALISAAPELLAACEAVRQLVSCGAFHDVNARLEVWAQVDKAVAKAKGGAL